MDTDRFAVDDGTPAEWSSAPTEEPYFVKKELFWNPANSSMLRSAVEHPVSPTEEPRHFHRSFAANPFREEPGEEEQPPPPICIPADVAGVVVDPFENPLVLGNLYTFSPDSLTGTEPITFQWKLNSVNTVTTQDYAYTLQDADIQGKDEFGLGHITVSLVVFNACNETGTEVDGIFAAQGTPP